MNGASALIHALEDLGVTQVFGIPGVQNIEIYDALADSGIEHVLARHEQAAVHMADGYARSTGSIGVVFATSGPGATNTVTGIATAYMDSIPVVVVTGQVSTAAIGTDAFQEADITTITLPITKHSYLLKEADELVPAVFEAFYLAQSGRPGPVLIDVPGNVARAQTTYHVPKNVTSIPSYKPTVKGNARQIKAAANLLIEAERPVLLAGGGVVSSAASEEVRELAELLPMPVVTTLLAKGVMPSTHSSFVGQLGVYGLPAANAAVQQADLVLAVGTRFSERITGSAPDFAPDARIIHIDIDPAEIGKNIRVDVPIVGDAATVLQALVARLREQGTEASHGHSERNTVCHPERNKVCHSERSEESSAHKTQKPEQGKETGKQASRGLQANATHTVFTILNDELKKYPDVYLTTDVGQHQLWASHVLTVEEPRRFLTSGGLGTMGFGLPAAIGVQLAQPESMVLCISGDGSFQMNLQEMATATINKLPIKVAIINNHSLGMVRQYQELFLEERCTHTVLSDTPDYLKLAEAYQWQGKRLDATAPKKTLREHIRWLLKCKGPALLDIVVPTEDLLLPMVKPGASLLEVV